MVATGVERPASPAARRAGVDIPHGAELKRVFLALDQLILEGVSAGAIRCIPREELHCTLVVALTEAAARATADPSIDWVADAAALFLAGVAAQASP
jgi:hypothetical protein